MTQFLLREGIIIDCGRRVKGQTRGHVPPVPSRDDRYSDFAERLALRGIVPKGNNHPWVWRGKNKPKTFLSKKPKTIRRKKETVAI